ncbi:MAG: TetR/AcrR family transcriptional regulator, partial [Pseudomonadota bacterium]
MEVLRSWMEDPDATDLYARVSAALDTVDALLGIASAQKGPSNHG